MSPPRRRAIIIHPSDNVATALAEIPAGRRVTLVAGGAQSELKAFETVPLGHKLALKDIAPGEPIVKYGETVGRATRAIAPGGHVHVQNVESERGRGDRATGEGA